jgi:hypothetical protein
VKILRPWLGPIAFTSVILFGSFWAQTSPGVSVAIHSTPAPGASSTPACAPNLPTKPLTRYQWLQLAVQGIALITAFVAVVNLVRSVSQKHREFAQSQITCAIRAAERITGDASTACTMLDYTKSEYDVNGVRITLSDDEVRRGLRIPTSNERSLSLSPADRFIRRSFDALFYRMNILAAELSVDLFKWPQVSPFIGYYLDIMRWPAYSKTMIDFTRQYGYYRVTKMISDESTFPVSEELCRIWLYHRFSIFPVFHEASKNLPIIGFRRRICPNILLMLAAREMR